MKIHEISLSDAPISMQLDLEGCVSIVTAEFAYHLSGPTALGETTLHITGWKFLKASKFVSSAPGQGIWEDLDLSVSPESFKLIQEIESEGEKLIFRGFSKESGHWLVYEFTSPLIHIDAGERDQAN